MQLFKCYKGCARAAGVKIGKLESLHLRMVLQLFVQQFLQDLSVIDSYRLDIASGNEILFQVQIQGGRDRLAAALEFSGILERNNWLDAGSFYDTSSTPRSLEFVYRPYVPDVSRESYDAADVEGGAR